MSSNNYFKDLQENPGALRVAKHRGQTFNQLIRDHNHNVKNPKEKKRTVLDSTPSLLEGYSGDVRIGVACTVCHHLDCVPVEHRYMCVPCWKVAGNMTSLAGGHDGWIYDLGILDLTDPEDNPEFDDETLKLLNDLDIDVDLEVALAPEPLY